MTKPSNIEEALRRIELIGPLQAMLQDERAAGFTPVLPGEVPWLLKEDWPDDVVVSVRNQEVRIVGITAKRPGFGAFSRLISRIATAKLHPIVVAPVGLTMPAIMRQWGWYKVDIGEGFEHEEQWHPPNRRWLKDRAFK